MNACIGYAIGLEGHPEGLEEFGFEYGWLEGLMEAELNWLHRIGDKWSDARRWPGGRLFGDKAEYRWRHRAGRGIHAVMIADGGALPKAFAESAIIELQPEGDESLILWGEWVDPAADPEGNPAGGPLFYAAEIPSIQAYPLAGDAELFRGDGSGRLLPCMVVRRYAAFGGAKRKVDDTFTRCLSLEMTCGKISMPSGLRPNPR